MIVRDSGHPLAHVSAADALETWAVVRSGAGRSDLAQRRGS